MDDLGRIRNCELSDTYKDVNENDQQLVCLELMSPEADRPVVVAAWPALMTEKMEQQHSRVRWW